MSSQWPILLKKLILLNSSWVDWNTLHWNTSRLCSLTYCPGSGPLTTFFTIGLFIQGWTLKMTNSHFQKSPHNPSDTQYRVQISHHSGISWLTEHSSHQSVFGWKNDLQCIKSPTSCKWKKQVFYFYGSSKAGVFSPTPGGPISSRV